MTLSVNTDQKTAYLIRRQSAGIILIINQKTFHFDPNPAYKEYLPRRRLETRHGTERDSESLQMLFRRFGYQTRVKKDRSHTEILNDVRDVINESVRFDSVIVCILSHGYKGVVYGANSVPVRIEDIEKIIISDRLIGKPKILIVQACQGEETQRAREVFFLEFAHSLWTLANCCELLFLLTFRSIFLLMTGHQTLYLFTVTF